MTENSLVERLEPCPFCGKSAQGAIYSCARISVYCECGARGPSFWTNGSTDAASADYRDALIASEQAWNRRASATTIAELRGQVERLREALLPFAEFAVNVDEAGWTSRIHKEAISTWFGPSEFRAARTARDLAAATLAAERALASKDGVQVKALEWDNRGYAHVPFEGRYYVGVYRPGQWEMRSPGMEDSTFPDGLFGSEDAAKAAAQADYDRRIRSALTTPPPAQDAPVGGETIPSGVYYGVEHDNFYSVEGHHGQGNAFYAKWRSRAGEFPGDPRLSSTPTPPAGDALREDERALDPRLLARIRELSSPAKDDHDRAVILLLDAYEDKTQTAAVAGWNACRKSIYAVCEDVGREADETHAKAAADANLTEHQKGHVEGYRAGMYRAAKSIARGFNAMNAMDDDNLRAALHPAPTGDK